MSRLVAFGCSYTYGHGLDDCITDRGHPGPYPSKFAWPQLLADKLNLTCVNMGQPGSSNKRIWKSIMDFDFRANDKVFVMWSNPNRHCIFYDNKTIEDIGPWIKTKVSRVFYKLIFSEYDQMNDLNLKMSHVKYHLDSLGIDHYQHPIRDWSVERFARSVKTFNNITPFSYTSDMYPKAADNMHPGEEAHAFYAEEVYKILMETK